MYKHKFITERFYLHHSQATNFVITFFILRSACPTPPSIEFGFLMPLERATPYFEGDLIVYKCNDGFEINGDFVGVCQADGSWSLAKLPFCGGGE